MKRVKEKIRKLFNLISTKLVYPSIYYALCKKRISPKKVVFIEPRHDHITNSFELLFDELATHYDFDIETAFLGQGVVPRWRRFWNEVHAICKIADAKYVFIDDSTSFLNSFTLRKDTALTQTWHACGAFKRFGYSTQGKTFGMQPREAKRQRAHKNYSNVFISSEEVKWAYAQAFHMEDREERIISAGVSRTDKFFDEEFRTSAYRKLHQRFPQAKDKKVVLYCPTFRGWTSKAKAPDGMDLDVLESLSSEYVMIWNHHPCIKELPAIQEQHSNWVVDLTREMSTEELLCVADICITDYSSVIFEYSLFDKPILFFACDIDDYEVGRGFYYNFYDMAPGPIARTNEELLDAIQNIDQFDYAKLREFREKFMGACDGHSTARILELVFGDDLQAHRRDTTCLRSGLSLSAD
jgi:CDP-glycerol glycerophosphotransferase (TagB/SpsB family)